MFHSQELKAVELRLKFPAADGQPVWLKESKLVTRAKSKLSRVLSMRSGSLMLQIC